MLWSHARRDNVGVGRYSAIGSFERGAVMQTRRFMLTLQGSGASSLTRLKVTGYLDLTARFILITDIPAPAAEGHIRD